MNTQQLQDQDAAAPLSQHSSATPEDRLVHSSSPRLEKTLHDHTWEAIDNAGPSSGALILPANFASKVDATAQQWIQTDRLVSKYVATCLFGLLFIYDLIYLGYQIFKQKKKFAETDFWQHGRKSLRNLFCLGCGITSLIVPAVGLVILAAATVFDFFYTAVTSSDNYLLRKQEYLQAKKQYEQELQIYNEKKDCSEKAQTRLAEIEQQLAQEWVGVSLAEQKQKLLKEREELITQELWVQAEGYKLQVSKKELQQEKLALEQQYVNSYVDGGLAFLGVVAGATSAAGIGLIVLAVVGIVSLIKWASLGYYNASQEYKEATAELDKTLNEISDVTALLRNTRKTIADKQAVVTIAERNATRQCFRGYKQEQLQLERQAELLQKKLTILKKRRDELVKQERAAVSKVVEKCADFTVTGLLVAGIATTLFLPPAGIVVMGLAAAYWLVKGFCKALGWFRAPSKAQKQADTAAESAKNAEPKEAAKLQASQKVITSDHPISHLSSAFFVEAKEKPLQPATKEEEDDQGVRHRQLQKSL